jgi:Tat protein translocase TatB subunit
VFDVGFPELVLVFIIGLLVLGPQRLPKVAAEVGKWVGRARRTASELRRQLEREIELSDVQPPSPPGSPGQTGTPPLEPTGTGSDSMSQSAPTPGTEPPDAAPTVAGPKAPTPEPAERPPQSR